MTRQAWLTRPVRVVFSAAAVAFCWFVLAPGSAHADDASDGSGKLLGGVTSAVTDAAADTVGGTVDVATSEVTSTTETVVDAGSATVHETTTAIASTTEDVPVVAPAATSATRTVDDVVSTTTTAAKTVVESTTSQVADVVEHTNDTVGGIVGTVADPITEPVDETVAETADPVREALDATPATQAPVVPEVVVVPLDPADELVALRHAERADDALRIVAATSDPRPAPESSTTLLRAVTAPVVAVVAATTPLPSRVPAPLQPLPYLVSAMVAGALAASSGGRGSHASADALPALLRATPKVAVATVRAVLARSVPGPALVPGSSPD